MSPERVKTLIIGGGQAGLAMSHMLGKRGCPHLVLERHRIAERWRTERWDGLCFQFPNWSVRLPDFPFPHTDPDAFASTAEIVNYLAAYAAFVAPPVRCGIAVTSLRRTADRSAFLAETSDGSFEADNVVIATGPYQRPIVPDLKQDDVNILQIHSSHYRNPGQLPAGAVLIVGAGASGAQITEELFRAGRRVYLSIGRHRRFARRYRGRDLMWWLITMGLDQTPVERRGSSRLLPLITGAYGGHTIDLRDYAAHGVTLLGRIESVRDGTLQIAPDLADSLAYGDAAYTEFLDVADNHVRLHNLDMPDEPEARAVQPAPACVVDPLRHLEPRGAGITSVIWATGYGYDYGWIDLPVLDGKGEPLHRNGVTNVPGLYFLGLQWLSKMNSSFLAGVGDDAARIADYVAARG